MISFLLLALLGTGLAAYAVEFFDDDGGETGEPAAETDIAQGTNQSDILKAMENQTVNGFAGDDTIEAVGDGAVVYGGPGDDRLFSFVGEDVTLNGGGGSDYIVFQSNGSEDSDLGFVQGGSGDDTIDAFGEDGVINGGAGNDIISIQGTLLSASGGAGNDTIKTSTYLNSADSFDTLTGGDGEDRFELIFTGIEFDSDATNRGVVTTITDFIPNEDVLVLPLDIQSSNGSVDVPITFQIAQADDDTYTDVIFSAADPAATATTITTTATIRLLGTTNLTDDNVVQADLERTNISPI
jgi:Ca2+-binding RTX toxin-like protein